MQFSAIYLIHRVNVYVMHFVRQYVLQTAVDYCMIIIRVVKDYHMSCQTCSATNHNSQPIHSRQIIVFIITPEDIMLGASCIANKIKPVLGGIINENQKWVYFILERIFI